MQEIAVDFSKDIKLTARAQKWCGKKIDATRFSKSLENFLNEKAQASLVSPDDLKTVFEIGYNSCADFYRPGKTEVQFAVARVNKYIKTGDQTLKTHREFFGFEDIELGLASIDCLKNKISNETIFAEEDSEDDDDMEDEEECECEDSEMDAEKGICAKCGKKMKAAKKD